MDFLEADTPIDAGAAGRSARYAKDANVRRRFHTRPKLDPDASKREGRPIYKDVTYIWIAAVGNPDNIVDRPATELDIARFPEDYKAFMAGESAEGITGTPLEQWQEITRAQAEELKALGVRTIEQVAEMPDNFGQQLRGFQALKQSAALFLDGKSETDLKLAEAEKTIDALTARLDALEAAQQKASEAPQHEISEAPKRRGRPPKIEV